MKQLLLLSVLAGCPHYGIVSFKSDRDTACVDDNVTLTWNVKGHAKLAIIKGTTNPDPTVIAAADFEPVDSKATHPYPIDGDTTFVLHATDADQANDKWQESQPVDVPTADQPKLATTTCTTTDTSRVCTGTFTVDGGPRAKVVRISDPKIKLGGKLSSTTLKVTHGSLPPTPLAPGQEITQPVPITGDWTLEGSASGSASDPPPDLQITVRIACP